MPAKILIPIYGIHWLYYEIFIFACLTLKTQFLIEFLQFLTMTKNYFFTFLFIITLIWVAEAQKNTVGFYNIENLFDTVDDPTINDEEFLPTGANQWTEARYQQKLTNMATVIAAMNVDVLGLGEIENRKVLEDLVQHPALIAKHYQIIHFDMNDGRGVDVALLYKPSAFKPFKTVRIPIFDPAEPKFKTRDILWVKGLFQKDTLHVAVNHWPSRSGGKEDKRLLAAEALRKTVDSVLSVNADAKMVMVGDFNDDPNNKSIKKILLADNAQGNEILFNASEATFKKGFGTLSYNGIWNLFDQVIISSNLLKGQQHYAPESFTIFALPSMLESKGKYIGNPKRTFRGGEFNAEGYSDHLPVYITIVKQ
jgi:endonuclease/exonuclease/phosphatase family metal-dependent hydrolase